MTNTTTHPYLIPFSDMGLPEPLQRSLRLQLDFQYAGQFCFMAPEEPRRFPMVGHKGTAKIATVLGVHGLELGSEDCLKAYSPEFANIIKGGKSFLQQVIANEEPHYAFVKGLVSNTTIMFKAACAQSGVKPSLEELQNAERDARQFALRRAQDLKIGR